MENGQQLSLVADGGTSWVYVCMYVAAANCARNAAVAAATSQNLLRFNYVYGQMLAQPIGNA